MQLTPHLSHHAPKPQRLAALTQERHHAIGPVILLRQLAHGQHTLWRERDDPRLLSQVCLEGQLARLLAARLAGAPRLGVRAHGVHIQTQRAQRAHHILGVVLGAKHQRSGAPGDGCEPCEQLKRAPSADDAGSVHHHGVGVRWHQLGDRCQQRRAKARAVHGGQALKRLDLPALMLKARA